MECESERERERKTDPATLVVGTYTGPEDRYDEWVAAAVVEMLLLSEP
jgi:hypothetical protein